MEHGSIAKKFPAYCEGVAPTKESREEAIKVYRGCKTQKLEKESFLPTYEENGFCLFDDEDPNDPIHYSLSVYTKTKDIKRFIKFNPPHKIAVGVTSPCCGVIQMTKERDKEYKKSSHVDFWLYENAKPYEHFELIDDFEEYMKQEAKPE